MTPATPPLYPYQQTGAVWLSKQKTALLADEMGVGKSPQAIHAAELAGAVRTLVVAPASVVANWEREIKRFQHNNRPVVVVKNPSQLASLPNPGWAVVSYDRMRTKPMLGALTEISWSVLILDESHFLKEKKSLRTKAVYGPECNGAHGLAERAEKVWCLSGTPMPNGWPTELWPMLFALAPNTIQYDSYGRFMNKYCRTVDKGFGSQIVGIKNSARLKAAIAPFILRRRKEEVLVDLPPIRFEMLTLEPDAQISKLENSDEGRKLRAVLVHAAADEKALGAVTKHIDTLRRLTEMAKVPGIVDIVEDELDNRAYDKIVVFAQHTDALERFYKSFERFNPAFLDGSTTDRQREIDKFQADPTCRVFIGQITAAGTGITLTAASDVMFASLSFTPASNRQAAMRCHRIGQKNSVLVRFASLAGSLDEQVTALLRRKTLDICKTLD